MCLMGSSSSSKPVKKTPILPGDPSSDDMVNDAVVPNQTDRSKQAEHRGRGRDYGGRDKYRTFDEEAARNPSGTSQSSAKTGRKSSNRTSNPGGTGTGKK